MDPVSITLICLACASFATIFGRSVGPSAYSGARRGFNAAEEISVKYDAPLCAALLRELVAPMAGSSRASHMRAAGIDYRLPLLNESVRLPNGVVVTSVVGKDGEGFFLTKSNIFGRSKTLDAFMKRLADSAEKAASARRRDGGDKRPFVAPGPEWTQDANAPRIHPPL